MVAAATVARAAVVVARLASERHSVVTVSPLIVLGAASNSFSVHSIVFISAP